MNELTGAFLIAQQKGENLLTTRQSLANAGYPIQEIEEALMESKQILEKEYNQHQVQPIKKKKKWWLVILIILAILIAMGGSVFFFWEEISSFIKGMIGG
jgi:hypothetical protein